MPLTSWGIGYSSRNLNVYRGFRGLALMGNVSVQQLIFIFELILGSIAFYTFRPDDDALKPSTGNLSVRQFVADLSRRDGNQLAVVVHLLY